MISIIIPIYNLECYLSRCLDSCVQQTYSNIEIICVNDGSTDNSSQIVEDYCRKDNRIVLINQKNLGVVTARNSGIERSKGEYLYFLDGDDFLHPFALEKLVNRMLEAGADVVKGNYEVVDERDILIESEKSSFNCLSNGLDLFNYLCSTGSGAIWNHLFEKTFFVANVEIPQQMSVGEDLYALLQLSQAIQKMICIEDITYCYRKRSTSVMNTNHCVNKEEGLHFRDKNIILCNILLRYADNCELLSIKQKQDIHLLVCDKMTTFILFLPASLLRCDSVFSLYKKCFLLNFQVQCALLRRSWKCYLSLLIHLFRLM